MTDVLGIGRRSRASGAPADDGEGAAVARQPEPVHESTQNPTQNPTEGAEPARHWLVPLVCVVAVALVVAISTVAVRTVGADPDAESPVGAVASPPATPSPAGATTGAGCATLAGAALPGAALVQSIASPLGPVRFFATDERWALCDDNTASPTLHPTRPLTAASTGRAGFRVSSTRLPSGPGDGGVRFVAGGLVPAGLATFEVAYTFPDGHVEYAATRADDEGHTWWRVVYTAVEGALTGDEARRESLAPLEVDVRADGEESTYSLAWGADTCVQVDLPCS